MALQNAAKKKIERITDPGLRKKFNDALKKSYVWDGVNDDKLPLSAQDVVDTSGIAADALEDKGILLSKRDVADYAPQFGQDITESVVKKKLTGPKYENHFNDGRKPVRVGRKLLVTYAEARSFFGVRSRGDLG